MGKIRFSTFDMVSVSYKSFVSYTNKCILKLSSSPDTPSYDDFEMKETFASYDLYLFASLLLTLGCSQLSAVPHAQKPGKAGVPTPE